MTTTNTDLRAEIVRRLLLFKPTPLTVGEAARVAGVHPQKLRRLERAGVVPAARRSLVHGDRLYDPETARLIRQIVKHRLEAPR